MRLLSFSHIANIVMPQDKPVTLSERCITAFIAAALAALIVLFGPLALLILLRGRYVNVLGLYLYFPIWGGTIVAAAAVIGFTIGEKRMLKMHEHLWATATPRRLELTALIWAIIAGIGIASVCLYNMLK